MMKNIVMTTTSSMVMMANLYCSLLPTCCSISPSYTVDEVPLHRSLSIKTSQKGSGNSEVGLCLCSALGCFMLTVGTWCVGLYVCMNVCIDRKSSC